MQKDNDAEKTLQKTQKDKNAGLQKVYEQCIQQQRRKNLQTRKLYVLQMAHATSSVQQIGGGHLEISISFIFLLYSFFSAMQMFYTSQITDLLMEMNLCRFGTMNELLQVSYNPKCTT